jgi:dTDP-4-dehydrorhamnose reductase
LIPDGLQPVEASRWLIVGADGQIGSALMRALAERGATVRGTTRRQGPHDDQWLSLDLAAPELAFDPATVDVAVFCAGVTSFAECEADPVLSQRVNVDGAIHVLDALLAQGVHVVYLSSNAVFDGAVPFASVHTSPSPQSLYGRQKALVEAHLTQSHPTAASILRLTKVVGERTPFIQAWNTALAAGRAIAAFENRQLCPVTEDEVVRVIIQLAQQRAIGLWQLGGKEEMSFAAFAQVWFAGRPKALAAIHSARATGMSAPHCSLKTHLPWGGGL